jgi:hypothetical protein
MYSEWLLPEEGACTNVTFYLNYSGTIRNFTTKGMVTCETGFVKSAAWWKIVNGKPAPATDCTSGTLIGYAACSFAEQAKVWSGECGTCPHVNLVRNVNETQYYKMSVTPELQAFAPNCIKGLFTPVVYGTATPPPVTYTVTPVAKFAPQSDQDVDMKRSSFMQSGPMLVGLFGLLLASIVVGSRMRMRAVRSPAIPMVTTDEMLALPTESSDVETSFE